MAVRKAKVDLSKIDRARLQEVLQARSYIQMNVGEICPNEYNRNKMSDVYYAALKANIANPDVGFTVPILVRPNPDKDSMAKWVIIDGEHRWKAASELGYTKIPVIAFPPMSEGIAQYIMVQTNAVHGATKDEDIKAILERVEELEGEFIANFDVWSATVIERPVDDADQYKFDDSDYTEPDRIHPITLYFSDGAIDTYKRIVGQVRLSHGCTAEEAILQILDHFEGTTGFGVATGDTSLDFRQRDLLDD